MNLTSISIGNDRLFMKIGILSDTHDDIDNVKEAIYRFKEQKVELIVHASILLIFNTFPSNIFDLQTQNLRRPC
jgi:Calcineurin-like phosphoesterase superfamily domain